MAQKQEPKTFEEYNFQEFLKTKKENEELKARNDELNVDLQVTEARLNQVMELVKKALGGETTKAVSEDGNEAYNYIYVYNRYIGLVYKDLYAEEDQTLVALVKLIELAKENVSREE